MDLHAWIAAQVVHVEALIDENEFPPSQAEAVRLRCEADRRVLARHCSVDDGYSVACDGCRGQTIARATLRALRSNASDFALTGRWRPEAHRIVYLFGRAYWWDRDPDGRLALQPAVWINAPDPPRTPTVARR
ncbi:hypothetical protein [Streptomyces ardesiacus]|uniref:hypothetical protein n=1 Tax=Streptomyces ardesiacus TaxID=285564 RepID=UPI002FDC097A